MMLQELSALTPTVVTPDGPPDLHPAGYSRPEALLPACEPAYGADGSGVQPALPQVGTTFLGFRLIAVLGRGAFGQVYLAEQGDLANRYVALKVARDIVGESQTLAQLQHTNIVPIYSIHRADPFQAVCMPYFGSTTLADVREQTQGTSERPGSGKVVVDTVNDRKRSTSPFADGSSARSAPERLAATPLQARSETGELPRSATAVSALQQLERMTFIDAILWIGERLADGLAHAHERGILHHDLKPANVLLTEDGEPMLLDFNLSEDVKQRAGAAAAMAGGTLPYMSPEHLDVFRNRTKLVDARSDIYSLGIILYELLAGQRPYAAYPRQTTELVARMIADRQTPPPSLRAANPGISPAVASIIGRCLATDPARRYQSARELHEDLRRQRRDLPLRYAPEPSLRERARKWVRRHPRLTSMTSVGTALGVVLLTLTMAFVVRGQQLARLESQETLRHFRDDARTVQFLLYSRHADRGQLEAGMSHSRDALGRFAILDNLEWQRQPAVLNLPADEQARLREEAGEMLFLLARATALHAQAYAPPSTRDDELRDAAQWSRLAEVSFGTDNAPKALIEQRAELARLLQNPSDAAEFSAQADKMPLRTPRDVYLTAHQQAIRGNLRQALVHLQKVTQEDPRNFSAWFVRGNCYYDLLQDGNAVACFNACVTLRPEFHWTWFNRGLAHLRLRQFRQAVDDFDRALQLNPELAEAYVNRALAREGLQEFAEAIADYTKALDGPAASTRVWFLRSAARTRAGDRAGAQRDFEMGLAAEPTDEAGWIARGSARRERDPKGALADYEQALQINPRSFDGLQNKAAILSDKFADDAAALEVMEQAVKLYPESVLTRGGRGVLLARAGKRPLALEDAQACLLLDSGSATQYQVGCIYALTSKQNANDRLQALPLLSAALRAGFGLEFVDHDADLDLIRPMIEFQRLVAAAQALR